MMTGRSHIRFLEGHPLADVPTRPLCKGLVREGKLGVVNSWSHCFCGNFMVSIESQLRTQDSHLPREYPREMKKGACITTSRT